MSAEKSPAFQFYAKDFLSDGYVRMMTLEQVGAYILLLSHQWLEGGLPIELEHLAKLCNTDFEAMKNRIWPGIHKRFEVDRSSGVSKLINKRLEREREKQKNYSRSRQKNAKSRWDKEKQGMHMHPVCRCTDDALHLQFASSSSTPESKNQTLQEPCQPEIKNFKTPPKEVLRIFKIFSPSYIFSREDKNVWSRIFYELTQFEKADTVREYEMLVLREGSEKPPTYFMKAVWNRLREIRHEEVKSSQPCPEIKDLINGILAGKEHALQR